MSNSAAQFNLLKFVEHRPFLSANKMMGVVILFISVMMSCFFFQMHQYRQVTENVVKLEQSISQAAGVLQPLLQQGMGNSLAGVLIIDPRMKAQGFYPEFEAFSHLQVKGLWFRKVQIIRSPSLIKITGVMDDANKLDPLLKQIASQAVFKNIDFIGVSVNKGLLPDVPEKYQTEMKKFKIPSFYRFTIQTTALNQQEKHV